MWDTLLIFFKEFLLPALLIVFSYYFGKHRERISSKKVYDKKLFNLIDVIVNANEITNIIDETERGYLPTSIYSKVDALVDFSKNPTNQFIDKKIQRSFLEFSEALYKLCSLYSLSSYAENLNTTPNLTKLIYHKRGNINNQEEDLFSENFKLSKNVEKKYEVFRLQIKNKFYI